MDELGACDLRASLPPEIWGEILSFVDPGDLCNVALTSKYFNNICSNPLLWTHMRINKTKLLKDGIHQLFSIERFAKVKKLNLGATKIRKEQLKDLVDRLALCPTRNVTEGTDYILVEDVELNGEPGDYIAKDLLLSDDAKDPCTLTSEELNKAALQLDKLLACNGAITNQQLISFLPTLPSSIQLVDINLKFINLSSIPSSILSQSLSHLHTLNLCLTNLTNEQLTSLLPATVTAKSLKSLDLERVNLSGIPSDILSSAISRLRKVNLSRTALTPDQIHDILYHSVIFDSLENLNLELVNLSEVDSQFLIHSIPHCSTVNLSRSSLSTEQLVDLFSSINSCTPIKVLHLNYLNLSNVPPHILSQALHHLHKVDLTGTQINHIQLMALFMGNNIASQKLKDENKICPPPSSLKDVSLDLVNLSSVPDTALSEFISGLSVVSMAWTQLSSQQITTLISASLNRKTLYWINLMGLESYSNIPVALKEKAEIRLKIIKNVEHFKDLCSFYSY